MALDDCEAKLRRPFGDLSVNERFQMLDATRLPLRVEQADAPRI